MNSLSFASMNNGLLDIWESDLKQDGGDWKEMLLSVKALMVLSRHFLYTCKVRSNYFCL